MQIKLGANFACELSSSRKRIAESLLSCCLIVEATIGTLGAHFGARGREAEIVCNQAKEYP